MNESHGDFTVIQSLPPGVHYYRFIVDGKWQTDPGLPVVTDAEGEVSIYNDGSIFSDIVQVSNIIELKTRGEENSILSGPASSSPPGTYGQEVFSMNFLRLFTDFL